MQNIQQGPCNLDICKVFFPLSFQPIKNPIYIYMYVCLQLHLYLYKKLWFLTEDPQTPLTCLVSFSCWNSRYVKFVTKRLSVHLPAPIVKLFSCWCSGSHSFRKEKVCAIKHCVSQRPTFSKQAWDLTPLLRAEFEHLHNSTSQLILERKTKGPTALLCTSSYVIKTRSLEKLSPWPLEYNQSITVPTSGCSSTGSARKREMQPVVCLCVGHKRWTPPPNDWQHWALLQQMK